MEIKEININEIKPYEKNPRKNQKAVPYVARSIEKFGFKVPIVIDRNNVIVAGHTRYLAAMKLGYMTVPCIVADDLTDKQVKAFRLADNKVAEKAEWDFDLLNEELMDLDAYEMFELGFEDILKEEAEPVEDDYEPDIEEARQTNVKPGQIYKLGKHRLMCGDSTNWRDVEKLLEGGGSGPSSNGPAIQCRYQQFEGNENRERCNEQGEIYRFFICGIRKPG